MKITKLQPKYKDESLLGYKLWYSVNSISCQIEVNWDNQPYEDNMEDAESLFQLFHQQLQAHFNFLANSKTGEKSLEVRKLVSLKVQHLEESPHDLLTFIPVFLCTIDDNHYKIDSQTIIGLSPLINDIIIPNPLREKFNTFRLGLVGGLNLIRENEGLFENRESVLS